MANSNDFDENDLESLSRIFKQGLQMYNAIENNREPSNSPQYQTDVKNNMRIFEKATRLVSFADIFSKNEGIDEVATNDVQYFLLPALLGTLTTKLTSGERQENVLVAEVYFKDFLTRCNDYGLSNYEFKEKVNDNKPRTEFEEIETAVNTRANKIERFRQQKDLKAKLADLKSCMENEHVDEEIKRDYFMSMIKLYIFEAIDELNSIEMEKPILEHMALMKDQEPSKRKGPPPTPLKPIIITKDEVQKAVFGAGYPALPTMTVQEFYDKRVAEGAFPDPNAQPKGPMSLQQAAAAGMDLNYDEEEMEDTERRIEDDDSDYIEKMRKMDDFKDEHRRGWGNRMNRS